MTSQEKIAIKGPRITRLWKKLFYYSGNSGPGLVEFNGKKYVSSIGSPILEVPKDFTIEEVLEKFKRNEPKHRTIEWTVKGSNGKTEYKVTRNGERYSCSCPGFKFHGKCKHINYIHNKIKLS